MRIDWQWERKQFQLVELYSCIVKARDQHCHALSSASHDPNIRSLVTTWCYGTLIFIQYRYKYLLISINSCSLTPNNNLITHGCPISLRVLKLCGQELVFTTSLLVLIKWVEHKIIRGLALSIQRLTDIICRFVAVNSVEHWLASSTRDLDTR